MDWVKLTEIRNIYPKVYNVRIFLYYAPYEKYANS